MKSIFTITDEDKKIIESMTRLSPDALDSVRSVLHSASIKKGYDQPALVLNEMEKIEGIIDKGLERHIPFIDIEVPEDYSQKEGYRVDVYVETEDTIYLIDPKSAAHNNNTPISDEVKKWVLAKKQVEFTNPNKEVRFILLKPSDVKEYEFNRLKGQYIFYGIELYKTDVFLSEITKENISVSEILKSNKYKLMCDGIRTLL